MWPRPAAKKNSPGRVTATSPGEEGRQTTEQASRALAAVKQTRPRAPSREDYEAVVSEVATLVNVALALVPID